MGINVSFRSVPPDALRQIIAKPVLCMEAYSPEEVEHLQLDLENDPSSWMSLEKAWHGVHYLYTGVGWGAEPPLSYIAEGGVDLEWEESWFEVPPRALTPEQVQAWEAAVASADEAAMRARFDPAKMTAEGIVPVGWDQDSDPAATLEWLMRYLSPFRTFLAETVKRGWGIIAITS